MPRKRIRWLVSKTNRRMFRPWSVELWDYSPEYPGTFYMETRYFRKFKKALAFAFSQEADEIRDKCARRLN